jgi:hypothetical protein
MEGKNTEIPFRDVIGPMLKMRKHNMNAKYKGENFKLHSVTLFLL